MYQYFIPFYVLIILHCINIPDFVIHSQIDGLWGCFHFLAVVNNADVDMCATGCCFEYSYSSGCEMESHCGFDWYFSADFFFFFGCAMWLVGILVPRPRIEPGPPAVEAPSPNYWTAREFPAIVEF